MQRGAVDVRAGSDVLVLHHTSGTSWEEELWCSYFAAGAALIQCITYYICILYMHICHSTTFYFNNSSEASFHFKPGGSSQDRPLLLDQWKPGQARHRCKGLMCRNVRKGLLNAAPIHVFVSYMDLSSSIFFPKSNLVLFSQPFRLNLICHFLSGRISCVNMICHQNPAGSLNASSGELSQSAVRSGHRVAFFFLFNPLFVGCQTQFWESQELGSLFSGFPTSEGNLHLNLLSCPNNSTLQVITV